MAMFGKLQSCFVGPSPFSSIHYSPYAAQETQHQQSMSLPPQQYPTSYSTTPPVPSMEFTYSHFQQHQQQLQQSLQSPQQYTTFHPNPEYKPREGAHDTTLSSLDAQSALTTAPTTPPTTLTATATTEDSTLSTSTPQQFGSFLASSPLPAPASNLYNEQQQLFQQQIRRDQMLISEQPIHSQQQQQQQQPQVPGVQEHSSSSTSPQSHSPSSSPNTVSIANITPLASPTLSECFSSISSQGVVPDLIAQSAPLPIQALASSQPVVTSMETTVAPGNCASPPNTLTMGNMQPNHPMSFDNSLKPDMPIAWMNNMFVPPKMARFEQHQQHQQHQSSPSRYSSAYRFGHGNQFLATPGRIAPTRSMSLSCSAGDVLSEHMLAQQQLHHSQHPNQQQQQRRSMSISVYPSMTFTHSSSSTASAVHSISPSSASGTPFSSMASSPTLSPMSMTGSPVPPMGTEWEFMQQHDQSMSGFHGFGSPASPSTGMHQMSLEPKHITPHPFASYTFPPVVQDQQESSPSQQKAAIASNGATRSRKSTRSAGPTAKSHQRQPTPLMLTSRLPSPLSSQPSSPITSANGLASANASRHRKSSLSISSSSSLSSSCSTSSSPSLSSGSTNNTSAPSTPCSSSSTSAAVTGVSSSGPDVHACLECDMTFAGPAVLLRHQESIHKKIAWCCMGCGSRLCRRDAVTRHMNLSPTGSVCRQVGEIGQLNKVGDEYVVVERNPYVAKPLRVVLTKMGKRLPPGLLDEEAGNHATHQDDSTATTAAAPATVTVKQEPRPILGSLADTMPSSSLMMTPGTEAHTNNIDHPSSIAMHSRKRSSPGDEHSLYSLTEAPSPFAIAAIKPDRKQRKQKGN
ncbi:hypothetical protein BGW42_008540 [Actinomortierella wolfii]|nr:hypothetical protein BGW42_008540 [Actinomortierella wolfii]